MEDKEQFKLDAKLKAISIAETLQPSGRNMQALAQGVTEVKNVKTLISDAQTIYDWLIKDL